MINRRRITNLIDPRDIAPGSMLLWLDAADQSTITLNGTTVSQWNDKSGNGNHFVQGAALNQPTYTINGQGGLPVVTFDGANSYMTCTLATTLGVPWTVGAVLMDSNVTGTRHVLDGITAPVAARLFLVQYSSTWRLGVGTYNSAQTPYGSALSNKPYVLIGTNTTSGAVIDSIGLPSYSDETYALFGTAVPALTLGCLYAISFFFIGYIAELFIYSTSLSREQFSAVRTYCARKWTVPLIAT